MTDRLRFWIPGLVVSLAGLSLLASQAYNPALPLVAAEFQITSNQAQYTLAALMLGIAMSGILYGALSDIWGRRPMVLLSLVLHSLMAGICVFAPKLSWLMVGCFLLGIGGGGGGALGLAILKDHFVDEKDTARVMAQMSMVIVLIPVLSQILGSNIAAIGGWRFIFLVLSVVGVFLLTVCWKFMPETRKRKKTGEVPSIKEVLLKFCHLLKDIRFVSLASAHTLLFFGVYCYMTVAPFVFLNVLGVRIEFYGFYVAIGGSVYMGAGYVSQRLVNRLGTLRLMNFGIGLCLVGAISFLLLCFVLPTSPLLISLVFAGFISGIPFVMPTSIAKAMEGKGEQAGAAASLVTTFRMAMAFVGTLVGGLLPDGTFYGVAIFLVVAVLLAKLLLVIGTRRYT